MVTKCEKGLELESKFKILGYKTLCFPESRKGYEIKRPYFVMELSEIKKLLNKVKGEILDHLSAFIFGYEFDKCICKNPHCEAHEKHILNKIKELREDLD